MGVLIRGAEQLLLHSEKIALRFHIPDFIIGATLIAFGTSLPELATAVVASYNHKDDIAIANVIGSNILNITLVLASVFLLLKKVQKDKDFFVEDSIWALIPVLIFILMLLDGIISRFDALLLIILIGAYIFFLFQGKKEMPKEELNKLKNEPFSWITTIPMIFISFLLVIIGSYFTVESASQIAHQFKISEWIISIILISFGTSLPELVISITSTIKGKVEIAIGNIIGSNIANMTIVLGLSALTNPLKIDASLYLFDIFTLVISSFFLIFITAKKLYSKSIGVALLILLALFLNHTVNQMSAF